MTEGALDIASAGPERSVGLGLKRGLQHRCPACGEGRLYARYLKVEPHCEACAHPLGDYRADDGPAYLTILIVGHLIVAPLLLFPFVWEWTPWAVLPLTLIPLAAAVLLLLPRIKGAWVGLLWATRAGGRDAEGSPQL
jgi:uncharacterized protein (DUF983 family)